MRRKRKVFRKYFDIQYVSNPFKRCTGKFSPFCTHSYIHSSPHQIMHRENYDQTCDFFWNVTTKCWKSDIFVKMLWQCCDICHNKSHNMSQHLSNVVTFVVTNVVTSVFVPILHDIVFRLLPQVSERFPLLSRPNWCVFVNREDFNSETHSQLELCPEKHILSVDVTEYPHQQRSILC